jgi:septal ring factor EnvC (AmiA/AmiB activator)
MDVTMILTIVIGVLLSIIGFLGKAVYAKLISIADTQTKTDVKIAEVLKDVQQLNKQSEDFKLNNSKLEAEIRSMQQEINSMQIRLATLTTNK